MSELLPCPNVTTEIRHPASGVQVRFRNGDNLGAEPLSDWIPAAELLAAWNRRSPPSVPPSVTVEECDAVTAAVREADQTFQRVGGSSRHWVRDCFLPTLEKHGLCLSRTEKARESFTCVRCNREQRIDQEGPPYVYCSSCMREGSPGTEKARERTTDAT